MNIFKKFIRGVPVPKDTQVEAMSLPENDDPMLTELPEGLTSEQVAELTAAGKVNSNKEKNGKSYLRIVTDNLFTFFNVVWAVITLVLVLVGSFENLTFLLVVVPNILIAIFNEAKAKYTVEKLSVTTQPKATVVRDGALCEIPSQELVLGDCMRVEIGRQVLCDSIVVSGICEVNESMLTGESVPIKKKAGDRLYAGSFLVSGTVFAKTDRVGKDNYIHTLERAAKAFKTPSSNLFRDLNKLIKAISTIMIPIAIGIMFCNWFSYRGSFSGFELVKIIVEKTSGSVVGMIPSGIYLLVTLTLSLSVIRLSRKRTLVQDMYSIEMLASADVLCLDKTGTITDGTMQVSSVTSLDGTSDEEIARVMSYLEGADDSINATSRALIQHFGRNVGDLRDSVPFSSARKYSAKNIEQIGIYALGAPHFVPCDVDDAMEENIRRLAERGERVLLLVRLDDIHSRGQAVAMIAISDRIRPGAAETIAKFQEQDVTVKVISGDHAATVSAIATKVGIKDAEKYLSCENLSDKELCALADDFAVFGRVTPEQKVLLVKTLKKKGHTVAMTGDGVNDTLALKEANCAIAMADGSEVASKISQIVLLDSDFSTLPDVVREGRRCINNVRASSSLFLMKTIFTIFISLFAIFTMTGYPFAPNNFLFLELFVIGAASFLLALEPNEKRIKGKYLETVLVKSMPCAIAMFLPTLVILLVGTISGSISVDCRNAVAMCVVTLVGLLNLIFICRPYTKWRAAVVAFVGVMLCAAIVVSVLAESLLIENQIFGFVHTMDNPVFFGMMLGLGLALTLLLQFFRAALEQWAQKLGDKKPMVRAAQRHKVKSSAGEEFEAITKREGKKDADK